MIASYCFLSFKFSINWATSSVDDGNIKKELALELCSWEIGSLKGDPK